VSERDVAARWLYEEFSGKEDWDRATQRQRDYWMSLAGQLLAVLRKFRGEPG
jgi:hypothetical protein